MTWIILIAQTVLVAGLAGTATAYGFGVAFIENPVAVMTSAYAGAVTAAFVRGRLLSESGPTKLWEHRVFRALVGAVLTVCVLGLFRTVLQFPLPVERFAMSGHNPIVISVVGALIAVLGLETASAMSRPQ